MIKGYKFLVNEEEKSRILNLHKNRTSSQYLILEEELTLPQTKTITFSSSDADSAHKIKDADVEREVRPLLNSIYNSGKNPKFTDATMKIDGKNGAYTTTVTLTIDESKNGIAYMGFTFRGSIDDNWKKRADGQIDGSENKDKLSMSDKIKTKLNGNNMDIFKIIDGQTQDTPPLNFREYFIQFSKNDKPSYSQNSSSETTNTNSKVTINSEDKRNLKFNNEGESSKKFTYMGGADLNYSTYYNKDKEGKYNGDIYQIYIYDSTLNSYETNIGLYVYGKPQNGPPDPTEIKFNPNDKQFIKFQDLLNQTKTKEEWDKLVQDSLDSVTPTLTPNSQSQSQIETKIEFQKPTDHKTALDQIKKELNVQQGDNISDAVLKFLKANTPKN